MPSGRTASRMISAASCSLPSRSSSSADGLVRQHHQDVVADRRHVGLDLVGELRVVDLQRDADLRVALGVPVGQVDDEGVERHEGRRRVLASALAALVRVPAAVVAVFLGGGRGGRGASSSSRRARRRRRASSTQQHRGDDDDQLLLALLGRRRSAASAAAVGGGRHGRLLSCARGGARQRRAGDLQRTIIETPAPASEAAISGAGSRRLPAAAPGRPRASGDQVDQAAARAAWRARSACTVPGAALPRRRRGRAARVRRVRRRRAACAPCAAARAARTRRRRPASGPASRSAAASSGSARFDGLRAWRRCRR